MLEVTLKGVEGLLGEALGWSGLKCRVSALYKQWNGSVKVIARIPGQGRNQIRLTRLIGDSFCDDVELDQLESEGSEYKAIFILYPEALADEAG